ncbi:MAG: hypothetical protein RML56_06425 [Burkholderiales bacterium]|nr:hypothetical protein [Burkholderiales bacterium]
MDPIDRSGEALLAERGAEVIAAPDGSAPTVRRLARTADALITRSKLPDDIFDAAPNVCAVTIHGTGTDLVPLAAADAHAVAVANLPGENARSVAEYCAMAMLMLARGIVADHERDAYAPVGRGARARRRRARNRRRSTARPRRRRRDRFAACAYLPPRLRHAGARLPAPARPPSARSRAGGDRAPARRIPTSSCSPAR